MEIRPDPPYAGRVEQWGQAACPEEAIDQQLAGPATGEQPLLGQL